MKPAVGKLADKTWMLWNSNSNRWFSKPCINLSTWASKMQSSFKTKHNSHNSSLWWSSQCLRSNQRSSVMSASVIRVRTSTLRTPIYSRTSRYKLSSQLCKQLNSSSPLDKSLNLWHSQSLSCTDNSLCITNSNNLSLKQTQSILRLSLVCRANRAQLQGSNHSTPSWIKRLHHPPIWILACSNIHKLWYRQTTAA